jgi:sugar O-acyltransferase (sialic acid O-acetyltransferase NeuD family)
MSNPSGKYCVILGGGGHAAVLVEALRAAGAAAALAILDADCSRWGQDVLGVPVRGGDDLLPTLHGQGADCFVVGLGATGVGHARRRMFEYGVSCGLEPLTVVHPAAVISPSARMGRGCQVLAGSVVQARAVLGDNVIVNTGAIVEHDCVLGDDVHLATGARLAGGVSVGRGSLVGLGAAVLQGLHVGEDAIVGGGAVVVRDVPDGVVVAGVPARPLRGNAREHHV